MVAAVLSHLYFTNLIESSTTRSFWPQLQQIPVPQKQGYANVNLQSLSPCTLGASNPNQVPGARGVGGDVVAQRSISPEVPAGVVAGDSFQQRHH